MTLSFAPVGKGEYSKYLSFLDRCFQKTQPRWFEKNMGHIFSADLQHEIHYLLKTENDLVGSFGIYPSLLKCEGVLLKTARIGSVAIRPEFQGRGFLSEMIKRAHVVMAKKKYQLAWLWGDSRIYGRYGWTPGGCIWEIPLNALTLAKNNGDSNMKTRIAGPDGVAYLRPLYNRLQRGIRRSKIDWHRHLGRKNFRVVCPDTRYNDKGYLVFMPEDPERIYEAAGNTEVISRLLNSHCLKHQLGSIILESPENAGISLSKLKDSGKAKHRPCQQIKVLDPGACADKLNLKRSDEGYVKKYIAKSKWWISRLDYV